MKLTSEQASVLVIRNIPKFCESLAQQIERETEQEVSENAYDRLCDAVTEGVEDALQRLEL